ncbi:MAG: prolyl oligopeptidase family serine peptidase [Candidatus Cloacimonadaceae bacterium]|nr:prolyl oligopeptidase family serine peptidase [Candidatus Cloacimonadaceae bacterium]MDP3113309.1 prolyl oligopeptidase family serine peptidase [Candidatus Cloacimonadaceae bacterium]
MQKYLPHLLLIACMFCSSIFAGTYAPLAPANPDTTIIHGRVLIDPWNWLNDRNSPALQKVLKNERLYAKRAMKPSQKLERKLLKEFTNRVPAQLETRPVIENGYEYFSRQSAKQAYAVHWRRKLTVSAKDELILDENKLAKGKRFFALGAFEISPDNTTLAYTADFNGDEVYRLYLKNLHSGKTHDTKLIGISEFLWLAGGTHAIITRTNSRMQTDTCDKLDLQTLMVNPLVRISDSGYNLGIYYSRDKQFIILSSSSKNTNEAWLIDARGADSTPRLIAPKREGIKYFPDIHGEKVFLQTNLWCKDGSIALAPLSSGSMDEWVELISGAYAEPISSFSVFDDHLILLRRLRGKEKFQIYRSSDGSLLRNIIPSEACDLNFQAGSEPNSSGFCYAMESFLFPARIYKHDFASGVDSLAYTYPLPMGYDPSGYRSLELFVPTDDGVFVPLTLVFRSDLDLDRAHPLWLYGYGAYGDYEDPWFSPQLQSLLDRGVIYAVAQVRGGGELGQDWYDGGRLLNKKNSFFDFSACLSYLQAHGFTEPDKTVIEGGSAGGLLVAAVLNLAPESMRLLIADVPFVDVINTMLDDSLPLTAEEYEEWGNPAIEGDFTAMLAYSPYENVKPANLPDVLISCAWHDTRVGYWEGLKWAQKLRLNNTGNRKVIYRLLMDEGHTGSGDRNQFLKYQASTMAYALSILGIK